MTISESTDARSVRTPSGTLEVTLTPDEASAVVMAIAWEVGTEGEALSRQTVSSLPGHLYSIASRCDRIASFNEVARTLKWRAHWGLNGQDDPPAIELTEKVLLDLTAVLHYHSDQGDDEEDEQFEFAAAARTLALAFSRA